MRRFWNAHHIWEQIIIKTQQAPRFEFILTFKGNAYLFGNIVQKRVDYRMFTFLSYDFAKLSQSKYISVKEAQTQNIFQYITQIHYLGKQKTDTVS